NRLGTLLEVIADVIDQIFPLPVLEAAVGLAGLLVVGTGLAGLVAPEVSLHPLVVVLLRLGRLFEATHDAGLVVDVLALAMGVHARRHGAVALVGMGARFLLRGVDGQLQIICAHPVALGVGVGQGAALQHL